MEPISMQVVNWEAVGVLAGFIVLWSGLLMWAAQVMMTQHEARIGDKIDDLKSARDEDAKTVQTVKDDLARLRAELPLQYVRREDAIRQETVFHHKLDAIYGELKELREKLNS